MTNDKTEKEWVVVNEDGNVLGGPFPQFCKAMAWRAHLCVASRDRHPDVSPSTGPDAVIVESRLKK